MAGMSSSMSSPSPPSSSRCLLLFLVVGALMVSARADNLPTVFMFGDSTFDVGTNDYIPSGSKANFRYNGIDYPHSTPTGRFSNGYNTADLIAIALGHKQSPPPFLALLKDRSNFPSNLLQGANFASGGSGILHLTGKERFQDVISMRLQVQQFATVRGNITRLLGLDKSAEFIAKSLFFISVGSNDILDHHYYNQTTVSLPQLMADIQSNFTVHLTNLYNLGARKFGIISVPPIGCCPAARVENWTIHGSGCLTELNDDARAFYSMVSALLPSLSSQLPGMIYSLGDAYNITFPLLKDHLTYGFKNIEEACCGKGRLNGETRCNIFYSPNLCANRTEYLFWDRYHPTEFASLLATIILFIGDSSVVAPMNFSQLAGASP